MPLNLTGILDDIKRNWDVILAVLLALFTYVEVLGRPLKRLLDSLAA